MTTDAFMRLVGILVVEMRSRLWHCLDAPNDAEGVGGLEGRGRRCYSRPWLLGTLGQLAAAYRTAGNTSNHLALLVPPQAGVTVRMQGYIPTRKAPRHDLALHHL